MTFLALVLSRSRSNDALLDIGLNLNESNSDTASIKSLPLSASFDSLQPSGMLDTLTKTKSNNDIQIPNLLDTEGAFGSTTSSPNQGKVQSIP